MPVLAAPVWRARSRIAAEITLRGGYLGVCILAGVERLYVTQDYELLGIED
jgi:hypothetical protein